jgi:hypothetical protein
MEISEATAREINRYFNRLVKMQPGWLKDLFVTERVGFVMDPRGELQLEMDADLREDQKEHARGLIFKYLQKHPAKFIRTEIVH